MKATGAVSEPKNTDTVIFEPGTYNTRLVEAFLVAGTKYQSDEAQIECVFRWEVDPEANPVRDSFNKVNYVAGTAKFEFQTERKYANKFQQRLEALLGQMLTAEDAARVDADIETPDFITNFDELLDHLKQVDDNGKPYRALIKSLKIGGQELIGGTALISLSITEKVKNGQKAEYQKIDAITALPKASGATRRAAPTTAQPQPAPATQADAPAQQDAPERLIAPPPPRRHASTEPDLPF